MLLNRVMEREKDQRTRLSRSSSALLDFEVSLYTLPRHMPPTTVFQRLRSRAILSISPQLRPTSSMSDMRASLHQFSGLPLFLFPCGFHVRVCRVMLDAGFRSVCPIKPHRLLFISISTGSCFVRCQSSALQMISGQCILSISLRQLYMKWFSWLSSMFLIHTVRQTLRWS